MSDLYADLCATFEWFEKEAARKAQEDHPGPIHPKLTDPHPQQASPTNPQSHPPQPQRTQPPAEPSPDASLSPDSCLQTPDSCGPPTSCPSTAPAEPSPDPSLSPNSYLLTPDSCGPPTSCPSTAPADPSPDPSLSPNSYLLTPDSCGPPTPCPSAAPADPSPDPSLSPNSYLLTPDSCRSRASRENGRKSHGPKTPEGKARSSMNALKHGLTARQVCVGVENEEEWNEFREEARRLLAPVGVIELEYADEWAAARWRLRRAYGIETLLFDAELADQECEPSEYKVMDAVARIGLAFKAAKEDIMALGRYASRIHRAGEHAHKMLLQLQRARNSARMQNEPSTLPAAPIPIPTVPDEPDPTCSVGSYPAGPGSQPGPLPEDRQVQSTTPTAPTCQNEPSALPTAPIPIPTVPDEPNPTCSAGSYPAGPGSQPVPLPEDRRVQSTTPTAPTCQNEPSALPAAPIPIPTVPDEPTPTCSAGSYPAGPGSQPGPLPKDRQNPSTTPTAPKCQNEPEFSPARQNSPSASTLPAQDAKTNPTPATPLDSTTCPEPLPHASPPLSPR